MNITFLIVNQQIRKEDYQKFKKTTNKLINQEKSTKIEQKNTGD